MRFGNRILTTIITLQDATLISSSAPSRFIKPMSKSIGYLFECRLNPTFRLRVLAFPSRNNHITGIDEIEPS
jgi:hypothetical protein